MLAEYNSSNALQRRYVFDPDGQPIVWYEGSGLTNRKFLSADERGTIVAASSSSGAMQGINAYDEYGVPAAANQGRFGYTGQAWLPGANVWYYRARMYEPEMGRFLQPDPVGYGDSPNLYAYVGNDPVNLIDPLGLQAINCIGWAGCGSMTIVGPSAPPGIHPPSTSEPGLGRRPIAGFTPLPQGGGPATAKPTPSKKRSTCAAGLISGLFVGGTVSIIEAYGVPILAGEIAGAGFGAAFASAGAATVVISAPILLVGVGLFAAVYTYDQSHGNASANALDRNTIFPC